MDPKLIGTLLVFAAVALGVFAGLRQSRDSRNRSRATTSKRKRASPLERYLDIVAESDRPPWRDRVREAWLPAPISELKRRLMTEMKGIMDRLHTYPDMRAKLEDAIQNGNLLATELNEYKTALEKLNRHISVGWEVLEDLKVAYLHLANYVPLMTEQQENELRKGIELVRDRPRSKEEIYAMLQEIVHGPKFKAFGRYIEGRGKRVEKLYDELVQAGLAEPWSKEIERRAMAELENRLSFKSADR